MSDCAKNCSEIGDRDDEIATMDKKLENLLLALRVIKTWASFKDADFREEITAKAEQALDDATGRGEGNDDE